MSLEQLSQPDGDPPMAKEGIHPAQRFSGKRLLLSLLGAGLVVLILAAARPALLKSALANFERAFPPKAASLPVSPAKITEHATEGPSAATPRQQTSPSAETLAQNFWAEFEKSVWGAPLQDWLRLHPDIPCEPFRGRLWGVGADRQWSHRCSTGGQPDGAHWSFYVFGLQEPLVARLEQFEISTATLPEEALGDVQNALQSQIAAHYGPGEDRSGPKAVLTHQVTWPRNVRWQASDLEVQLDLIEFDPQRKQGRLRLQGRHRALLEALNEDKRLQLVATLETGSSGERESQRPSIGQWSGIRNA